jgi:peptidoglycan/xylan/chitin deacetylase (PgdA/CDA1 family)/uncharacterized membrane protein YbhN (UPF0104 family)
MYRLAWLAPLLLVGLALAGAAVALLATGHAAAGLAATVAFALGLLGALQALWPRFDLRGHALRRGDPGSREVALTFDDGPSDDTPAVLEALDRAGVRASFFLLGRAAEARPRLVAEIARRGHLVALHGFSHAKLVLAGPRTVGMEVDRCATAVRAAGVEPAPYFRAPHGFVGPFVGPALRARGLTLVSWTRGVFDTDRPGPPTIVARACRKMQGGEILLLHDGCGTPGIDPRRDQTVQAVPEIVQRWREAGYRFVRVDDLHRSHHESALQRARELAHEAAPPARRTRALRLLGLAVIAACAALAVRTVDLHEVIATLARASVPWLILASGANILALAFHSMRWREVVGAAAGTRVRRRDAFAALVAGFAVGLAVPARAGDVVRAHLLASRARLSTAAVIGTIALDYVVGGAALVPLLGILALVGPFPLWAREALALALAIAVAGGAAAWLLHPPAGARPGRGIRGSLLRLRLGLTAARRPSALLASSGWAALGWTGEVLIAFLALRAFGLHSNLHAAALAVIATTAAAFISVSPGNAGPFEVAATLAVAGLGGAREAALAFALGYHLVHVVPTALVGVAALARESRTRSEPPRREMSAVTPRRSGRAGEDLSGKVGGRPQGR